MIEQIAEVEQYDTSLRSELESIYNDFVRAITDRNVEDILNLVIVSKSDKEVLRNEMSSDGFVSFSEWLVTTYPTLEHATFVSLKTAQEDLAGYYMAWVPSYSTECMNLTLIKYVREGGQWKLVFQLTEMASAAVQVRKDEDTLTKVLEVMNTNPLMALEHPGIVNDREEQVVETKVPERLAPLKKELEEVLATIHGSLEKHDRETFLSSVILSQGDGERLLKKFKKISKEILKNAPDLSQAVYVSLKTIGKKRAGYYFVAPYPQNPAFKFVYLRPFVFRNGGWKMVFSLDHDLAVSLNIAKSGGDLVSRAKEVIKEIDLLHLDWVLTSLFDAIIQENNS